MEIVYEDAGRQLRVGHLEAPHRFDSPFRGAEFTLLLVAAPLGSPAEMSAIAADVLGQGCRAVVCAGDGCQAWAAAFEEAHARATAALPPRAKVSIMTTSHPDETLQEVASHFATLTFFDDFVPKRFLLLVLGADELCLARYRRAIVDELRRSG